MTHDEEKEYYELRDTLLEWAENSDLVLNVGAFEEQGAKLLFKELLGIEAEAEYPDAKVKVVDSLITAR